MNLKCEVEQEKELIQKRISKNRDEIDSILSLDWPLELKYIRINMLSAQNERLIQKINNNA